jgi:xanthine dehydrogenase YagT iron-sulfur-binding subunit
LQDVGDVVSLETYRGHPVVLVFCPAGWVPARAALVDTYNRLVERVAGPSGARLLGIADRGPWRELSFGDAALSIPLLADDGALARRFGVGGGSAVFVLDHAGVVRWRHVAVADALPSPDELARALAALSANAPDAPVAPDACPRAGGWSRRDFVATALAASAAFLLVRDTGAAPSRVAPPPAPDTVPVTLRVNGRDVALRLEPRVTLLDALRERAGLTGSKKGCDHGQCGACTVHVDGRRVLSCLTLAVMAQGKAITTIEGLADGDQLHPMQAAFIKHDGFQCGYCTSGQIMSAAAVLREPWGSSDDDVREAMSGNICRCGAYPGIVAAVQEARRSSASTQHR